VKEGKLRRRAVLWVVALGGVLITAAVITLYAPWLRLFDLRELVVTGHRYTAVEEIVRAADLSRGQPLLSISLRGVMTRVETLPWIDKAEAHRSFPHTVAITITEREAIARLAQPDGSCLLLGTGGVILESTCDGFEAGTVVVGARTSGTCPGSVLADERVVWLIDTLHATEFPGLNVRQIDVSDLSSVVLYAESDLRIRFGGIEHGSLRVEELLALCSTIDVSEYTSIDLRLGGEATLVPR